MMENVDREWLFQVTFWVAALLYVWVAAVIWLGPEWALSGTVYFLVGILPGIAAVVSLAASMGIYLDLYKENDR